MNNDLVRGLNETHLDGCSLQLIKQFKHIKQQRKEMIQSPIDKLRTKTVSETLNPFKPTSMKPTPIADIQQDKLVKFNEEMDILISNRMNKLSNELLEGLKKEYDNLLFNSFESFEKGNTSSMSLEEKIELFKRLEEL